MTRIINLTPHAVIICLDEFRTLSIPPDGRVPRVSMAREQVGEITIDRTIIPVFATMPGEVEGLPDPEPETMYIVSRLVVDAAEDRVDLVSPDDLVRDSSGAVIGARSFSTRAPRP